VYAQQICDNLGFIPTLSLAMPVSDSSRDSIHPTFWRLSPATCWVLLILAALAFLLPGIFGHGPWKQDETYSFGIIHTMIETGNYLVPTNAGEPFMEKPPLYYWTAALFAKLLSPFIAYHDGARVASLFYMIISLVFITKITHLIWRSNTIFNVRTLAVMALFLTSAGMVRHAHDMFTDVALVCGGIIAFYGLLQIVLNERERITSLWGPFWFGIGVGITLMTKGLLLPIIYSGVAVLAPVLLQECRSRSYAKNVGIAVLISMPFFIIWPALLAQHSVPLFMKWFWDNNIGRFLGFSVGELGAPNTTWMFFSAPFQVLLPTSPLVIYALFTSLYRQWRTPHIALALLFSAICLSILGMSASGRHLYYLPLSFPFALLAINGIEHLSVKVSAAWDWFCRIAFGGLTLFVWCAYVISMMPVEQHHWLSPLEKWLPLSFVTPFTVLPFLFALALTIAWLYVLPRLKQLGQWRGAFSWFASMTMMWGVTYTVLLPWIDYSKSYEYTYASLDEKLKPLWTEQSCMASIYLGESEAPMLSYYTGIVHKPMYTPAAADCQWLIVQDYLPLTPVHIIGHQANGSIVTDGSSQTADYWTVTNHGVGDPKVHWHLFWTGGRDGDDRQLLRVFRREAAKAQ
jgi:4-amino-4-deoxy-L-arabinose transferase-like glycosyltransferase